MRPDSVNILLQHFVLYSMSTSSVQAESIPLATSTIYGEGQLVGSWRGGIPRRQGSALADKALEGAAAFWFLVVVIGQWMFVTYILSFYGRAVVEGDLARWNRVISHGYVAGDGVGNFVLALHLCLAVLVTVGGPFQLVPQIRARFPLFHRWNGRVYLATAFLAGTTALYLVWIRGGVFGNAVQHIGISVNAVLILISAAMALQYALARRFGLHRRWALRLFLVVSGAWFIRVGSMFWMIVSGSAGGFHPQMFQGPLLDFLSFTQYLLPLAVLEVYLRTQERAGARGKFAMAAGLTALTLAMGVGILGATLRLWLPRM